MESIQEYSNQLITIGRANALLPYKSRSSLEYYLNRGAIKYITVDEGTSFKVRLIIKSSLDKHLNTLKEGRVNDKKDTLTPNQIAYKALFNTERAPE